MGEGRGLQVRMEEVRPISSFGKQWWKTWRTKRRPEVLGRDQPLGQASHLQILRS